MKSNLLLVIFLSCGPSLFLASCSQDLRKADNSKKSASDAAVKEAITKQVSDGVDTVDGGSTAADGNKDSQTEESTGSQDSTAGESVPSDVEATEIKKKCTPEVE